MDHHPPLQLPPPFPQRPDHHVLDPGTASSCIPATAPSTAPNIGSSGNAGSCKSGSNFLCRQTSTRWIPTPDQIRILKDLYYNGGVRSPTAEEIQRISARLRQYGKIEGKNVFYWFQNHKARERQKRRLTVDVAAAMAGAGCPSANKMMTSLSPGILSPTSPAPAGLYAVGQMGASACGGSLLIERAAAFREMEAGVGWVDIATVPHYYYHHLQHQRQQPPPPPVYYYDVDSPHYHAGHSLGGLPHKEMEATTDGLETLPLFPTSCCKQEQHDGEEMVLNTAWPDLTGSSCAYSNYQHHLYDAGGSAAFLELTLNSHCAPSGST